MVAIKGNHPSPQLRAELCKVKAVPRKGFRTVLSIKQKNMSWIYIEIKSMRLTGGIMRQFMTPKRHHTFPHCLGAVVPKRPAFPKAQLYRFCSQDHSPEHWQGGERALCWGEE